MTAGYENHVVLENVTMSVEENDFIGIIGPNGGGKTTLLKVILGLLKPFSGRVDYSPGGLKLSQIGYMPQVAQGDVLFPVTVEDVVLSGLMLNKGAAGRMGKEERKHAARVMDELGLAPLACQALNELSGGQLQRVYLARAVSGSPRLLLLDEPAAGLTYGETKELAERLKQLRSKGMTILLIEHHMGMVMEIADEIAVLGNGELIAQGTPDQVKGDLRVIEAYLKGKKGDA